MTAVTKQGQARLAQHRPEAATSSRAQPVKKPARSISLGTKNRNSKNGGGAAAGNTGSQDPNKKHLQNLAEKRFEDDILKEVEFKRFHEAKRRLRHFLIQTDMSDIEER